MKRISHWIGGRVVAGVSGRTGPVYDPARDKHTQYREHVKESLDRERRQDADHGADQAPGP